MSTEVSTIKKKTLRWKKKRHGPKVTTITFAYYPVRFFGPLYSFGFRQHSRLKKRNYNDNGRPLSREGLS